MLPTNTTYLNDLPYSEQYLKVFFVNLKIGFYYE